MSKKLSIAIIILTLFSVQQWLDITVTTTVLTWIVSFYILGTVIKYKYRLNGYITNYIPPKELIIIRIYILWLSFNIIRGAFIAENYWEWKQLISGSLSLSLPLFVYIFSNPDIVSTVLKYWFKYALIIFVIILPFLYTVAYHFYLGPVFVLGCFIPLLPKKWRYILCFLLIVMLCIDLDARSQVIKSAVIMMIAIGIYCRKIISIKLLKSVHWACYVAPLILLFLGITGTFNIFQDLSTHQGKYTETKVVKGEVVEADLAVDTRTFIYVEVLQSAIKHNYVIWGRTPARGNDSMTFGALNAEELKTGKYERHSNELCHTNVFTWLGLIGVVLYSLIYLQSSYLAVYKSNNIYIKFIGCFVAFRWAYGWVEDMNNFSIMNLSLWMLIAMGISTRFRNMSNYEFTNWIKSIFSKYHKYNIKPHKNNQICV